MFSDTCSPSFNLQSGTSAQARKMPPKLDFFTNAEGETIKAGVVILTPYKNSLWPSLIRNVTVPKKTATFGYLPFYNGDHPTFKIPLNRIQLFKPEMELPNDAPKDLRHAYETARHFFKLPAEEALDVFKNPPPRPAPVEVKKEPKALLGKRKSPLKKNEHRDHDDRETGHEGDLATGAHLLSSDADDMDTVDELDALLDNESDDAPNAKRIRPMEANEIVFHAAPATRFKSKDQVVLIQNPDGVGLWPALPNTVSEQKGFASFELFPRTGPKRGRLASAALAKPKLIRTTNTDLFAFNDQHLNSMIKFSQNRSQKLQEALLDVKKYLVDNHRFDEKTQKDVKYKDTDVLADFTPKQKPGNSEPSALSFGDLRLTTSTGESLNDQHLMNPKPKSQLKETRLLQEKFAVSRQRDPKPIWLFSNPIKQPHYKLLASEMTSEPVRQYFDEIWCGGTPCSLHDEFYRKLESNTLYYPSSFRIDGCTGGLISDVEAEEIIQEYLTWVDLSTRLPRIPSQIKKLRYCIEVMLKEACIFVLQEKRKWTREKVESFLLDSQDHAFSLERGYCFDKLSKRVMLPAESTS